MRSVDMTLQQRIAEIMQVMKWEHADLMRVSGQSSSVVSQWRGKSKEKTIRSIGKTEAAEALEAATGYAALWIAKGLGPKMAAKPVVMMPAAPARKYSQKALRLAALYDDADPARKKVIYATAVSVSGLAGGAPAAKATEPQS